MIYSTCLLIFLYCLSCYTTLTTLSAVVRLLFNSCTILRLSVVPIFFHIFWYIFVFYTCPGLRVHTLLFYCVLSWLHMMLVNIIFVLHYLPLIYSVLSTPGPSAFFGSPVQILPSVFTPHILCIFSLRVSAMHSCSFYTCFMCSLHILVLMSTHFTSTARSRFFIHAFPSQVLFIFGSCIYFAILYSLGHLCLPNLSHSLISHILSVASSCIQCFLPLRSLLFVSIVFLKNSL